MMEGVVKRAREEDETRATQITTLARAAGAEPDTVDSVEGRFIAQGGRAIVRVVNHQGDADLDLRGVPHDRAVRILKILAE